MSCSDGCFPRAPSAAGDVHRKLPRNFRPPAFDRLADIFLRLAHRFAHLGVHFPNLADARLPRALALQSWSPNSLPEPRRMESHFRVTAPRRPTALTHGGPGIDRARPLLLVLIDARHSPRDADTRRARKGVVEISSIHAQGRRPDETHPRVLRRYAGFDVNQSTDSSERSVSNRKRSCSESLVRVARRSRSHTMRGISATTGSATSSGAQMSPAISRWICGVVGRSSARPGHSHRRIVREWREPCGWAIRSRSVANAGTGERRWAGRGDGGTLASFTSFTLLSCAVRRLAAVVNHGRRA